MERVAGSQREATDRLAPAPECGPPELVERLCRAKAKMPSVAPDGKKTGSGGQYAFASVNEMYESARPILAAEGLDVRMDFDSYEVLRFTDQYGNEKAKLKVEVLIGFVVPEGAEPMQRRLYVVRYDGPQATEHVVSYAAKQFIRQRLQVATGDYDDPDGGSWDDGGSRSPAPPPSTEAATRQQAHARAARQPQEAAKPKRAPKARAAPEKPQEDPERAAEDYQVEFHATDDLKDSITITPEPPEGQLERGLAGRVFNLLAEQMADIEQAHRGAWILSNGIDAWVKRIPKGGQESLKTDAGLP